MSSKIFWILLLQVWTTLASVYDKPVVMDQNCGKQLNIGIKHGGKLILTNKQKYAPNMDCTVTLVAPKNKRIQIYFKKLDIENVPACTKDKLDVYEGMQVMAGKKLPIHMMGFCGDSTHAPWPHSDQNVLTLHFTSDADTETSGFEIIFSEYHDDYCVEGKEFMCGNFDCIDQSLVCDGEFNCEDKSDEDRYGYSKCKENSKTGKLPWWKRLWQKLFG
ncbi:neuropilin and tolloid-like protein 1 isoform X2 [Tubulanus polymorphus]|uniref:neuropilin and tolloid-like protein 1 isoform X2 n=1 Tax=Tubulanus polymorphus TaxID=672921 RepID=UPI003DA477FC